MKKHIVKAITAIAALAILFAGTGDRLATANLVTILVSAAWLALVAFATHKRRQKHE